MNKALPSQALDPLEVGQHPPPASTIFYFYWPNFLKNLFDRSSLYRATKSGYYSICGARLPLPQRKLSLPGLSKDEERRSSFSLVPTAL